MSFVRLQRKSHLNGITLLKKDSLIVDATTLRTTDNSTKTFNAGERLSTDMEFLIDYLPSDILAANGSKFKVSPPLPNISKPLVLDNFDPNLVYKETIDLTNEIQKDLSRYKDSSLSSNGTKILKLENILQKYKVLTLRQQEIIRFQQNKQF